MTSFPSPGLRLYWPPSPSEQLQNAADCKFGRTGSKDRAALSPPLLEVDADDATRSLAAYDWFRSLVLQVPERLQKPNCSAKKNGFGCGSHRAYSHAGSSVSILLQEKREKSVVWDKEEAEGNEPQGLLHPPASLACESCGKANDRGFVTSCSQNPCEAMREICRSIDIRRIRIRRNKYLHSASLSKLKRSTIE